MKVVLTAQPGASLLQRALPNGTPITAIEVDNPTGAWLYIVSERTFIPPYTQGYKLSLTYGQTSISVQSAPTGPAGQSSTVIGDPWTLTLGDEPVVSNDGNVNQYVDNFTGMQVLTASTTFTWGVPNTTASSNLIVSKQRFRVHKFGIQANNVDLLGAPIKALLTVSPGFWLTLAGHKTRADISFSPPIDTNPAGSSMQIQMALDFATSLDVATFLNGAATVNLVGYAVYEVI